MDLQELRAPEEQDQPSGRERNKAGFFFPFVLFFFSFFLPCNELINSFRTELIYTH